MRIVSGEFKGRQPKGTIPAFIRPSMDSTRETIFNILTNYLDFTDINVMDLCCGTGIFGIETLSRGASHAFMVDKNFKALQFAEQFIKSLEIEKAKYSLIQNDVLKVIQHISDFTSKKFDLIFFDPPYKSKISNSIISLLSKSDLIIENGIIVAEHSDKEQLIIPEKWKKIKERKFGETIVDFIQI